MMGPVATTPAVRRPSMSRPSLVLISVLAVVALTACSGADREDSTSLDARVAEYIESYPYQESFRLVLDYLQGDPGRINTWVLGETPALVRAGEDLVVRMNNDTFYKMAFIHLGNGPVVLSSSAPSSDRFSSFQLMDDRNVNYANVLFPDGTYTLYRGEEPAQVVGEAIEVPSELSIVIVRVEVKDKSNASDVAAAEAVFNGIEIEGTGLDEMPALDLLSRFTDGVATEAHRRIDSTATSTEFRNMVAGPNQVPGEVSYLRLAAGTKVGWGGPVTSHSAYEIIFAGADGQEMIGSNGTYEIVTEAPPVEAFWSITAYDTERGGYFHPNEDDRYHINGTTGIPNADGTYTLIFKTTCSDQDQSCLEVPAGQFDITARYYLPSSEIRAGTWLLPRARLAP